MPVYKGKYIQQSDDTYTVELYKDDTVSETITSVRNANEAKGIILVWHAQQGYTRPDITDQNFTEDWENWESLYVKP